MPTHPQFVWFNGAVVPWDDARVHVSTATVLRGANIFEGIRAYWHAEERELYLFRNDAHLARLWESAKIMRMTVPWTAGQLTEAECAVLRANAFQETVWFRLTLYVGEGEESLWPPETIPIGGFILPRLSPR
jgi:branched-chain amino acid aminotransferase